MYEKILSFLFIMSILISGSNIPFYAQENVIQELDVYEDTSQYDELNAELEAKGREIINNQNQNTRRIEKIFNVTRLAQGDSAWKNVQLGTSSNTIGSAGCCLTSFTMIRNYLSGTADTPVSVNSVLGSYACPFNYNVAANRYGYTIATSKRDDSGMDDSTAKALIIGAMEEYNVPILIGFIKANGNTHFVVATGYNTGNNILIRDPGNNNYSLLSQYLNEGCSIHRIYCFTN